MLDEAMTKHGLKYKPNQKRTKKIRRIHSGNKTSILSCAIVAIQVMPLMVIISSKHFNQKLSKGEVTSTLKGMSDNGWVAL